MTEVTIKNKKHNGIPVREMKDGDVGVITNWDRESLYIGKLVKYIHFGDMLIEIGEGSLWWGNASELSHDCMVRIWDKITITEE